MGFYGFAHFPVLDDWVQYDVYAQFARPMQDVFIGLQLYTFRPLAGLLDVFFWSRITALAPFLITILHATSCILLIRAARKIGITLGIPFVIVYMFLPINSEATMWLSASTRLVVPMFFLSIALNFATGKPTIANLALFTLFLLISLAFYEQIAIIAVALGILVGISLKRNLLIKASILSGMTLAAYYLTFVATGPGGPRAFAAVPFDATLHALWLQAAEAWGTAHWQLFSNGIVRGMRLLFTAPEYLFATMAVSGFFVYAYTQKGRMLNGKHASLKIKWGLILFLLPFTIFFITSGHAYAFRNAFPSLIGLGIMLDGLLGLIPKPKFWLPIVAGITVFLFLAVGISQTSDYRAVSLADREFVEGLLPQTLQDYLIIDRIPRLVTEQNVKFEEHILSVTSSGWAITGAARAISGNLALPVIHVIWR